MVIDHLIDWLEANDREIVELKKRLAHVEHVTGACPSLHMPESRRSKLKP